VINSSMVWGDIVLSPQFSPVTGQLPVEKSGEFSSHVFELAQCTAVISSAAIEVMQFAQMRH